MGGAKNKSLRLEKSWWVRGYSFRVGYSSQYSLSHVALGGGVERHQLHAVRVLGSHLKQNLLEGVELAALCVHVVLIDLGHNNNNNNNNTCVILTRGK